MSHSEELSTYEREREKRIMLNKEKMESMGLFSLAKDLQPSPAKRPRYACRTLHPACKGMGGGGCQPAGLSGLPLRC